VPRLPQGREQGLEGGAALGERRPPHVPALEGEQVEGDEVGRGLAGEPGDTRLGGVDPILQHVEVEAVPVVDHHHLAVDHGARRQRLQRRCQLGEVAQQRLLAAAVQADRIAPRHRPGTRPTSARTPTRRRGAPRAPSPPSARSAGRTGALATAARLGGTKSQYPQRSARCSAVFGPEASKPSRCAASRGSCGWLEAGGCLLPVGLPLVVEVEPVDRHHQRGEDVHEVRHHPLQVAIQQGPRHGVPG
jgi:hypothetical protein